MNTIYRITIPRSAMRLFYFVLLLTISLVAYSRVLQFTFYLDDWGYLWKAQYHVQILLLTFLQWGTTLEFFVLTKLFGEHVVLWQLFGIVLRAVAAYAVGLMVSTVTRVRRAGILAGIFFACLPIGIQTVSWISAHVVDIGVIGSSVSFMFWVRFQRTGLNKFLWFSACACALSLVLDPFRVLPIILILGLYSWLSQTKRKRTKVRLMKTIVGILFVTTIIVAVWERQYISGSAPFAMIFRNHHSIGPDLLWRVVRLVGNYFWSLFNLLFGVVMAPVAPAPHLAYNIIAVITSAVLFLSTLYYSAYLWLKKRNEIGLYVFIFTSWMILFFVPCWISEPRQMVEPAHRYLVLPSVGLVGLVGYLVARIKRISFVCVIAGIIVAVNIFSAQRLLSFENIYRSRVLTEHFWNTINTSVPDNEIRSIFVFQGEEPVRTWTLELSGARPFALRRKISDAGHLPMITTDKEKIVRFLCKSFESSVQPIPLSHVHVWSVRNNGYIANLSREWSNTLRTMLVSQKCGFLE